MDVPYLGYGKLKAIAGETLTSSKYANIFPVEIELIVEKEFGIEIVPIPGLQKSYQIDAFITADLSAIWVDEAVLENRINRYRFTLAHELGHAVLHRDVFREIAFKSAAEWKRHILEFPVDAYRRLEYQANSFANAILVPQLELEARLSNCVEKIRALGMDPAAFPDECLSAIAVELGEQFVVSSESIRIRLENEAELIARFF